MKNIVIVAFFFLNMSCARKLKPEQEYNRSLFRAYDFTAENLFSRNIEGPAVDREGNLYVVNYEKEGTIGLIGSDGTGSVFVEIPDKSIGNSIQFKSDGNMLVADFIGHNILEVNPVTKNVSVYCHDDRFNQPNDICINRKGIVFASDPDWKKQTGQIWKIDTDRKSYLLMSGMGTTNGICLSPDEKTLYVNESMQRTVWAFDVNERGDISNKRIFAVFPDYGLDGMKCDTKGNLYVTRYGKGTVVILNAGGKQLQEVQLKGKDVSNITFGGKDFRTCFVTLQDRKSMEKFRTDYRGR